MRNTIISIAAVALVVGAVFALTQDTSQSSRTTPAADTDAPQTSEAIPVASFNAENVIGYLGHPLGTIVRVTGTAVSGDHTRIRKDAGKTLLKIQTVNGKILSSPVTFEFLRASQHINKPTIGSAFDYYVHEYGEFDGVVVPPKELGIDYVPTAHDGFYYRRYITVHKSLK